MESQLAEYSKSPNFMDTSNFSYDSMSGLTDPYLNYPHQSPYAVSSMSLPDSSSSPRVDFNSLNMSNGLTDYYSSGASLTTSSLGPPFTPPEGVSSPALYTLSAGELSSDGMPSGRSRRGSGTYSPASSASGTSHVAVPRSHRFNPMSTAAPATRTSTRRKSSRNEDSDDEDDDFQLAATGNANGPDMRRESVRRQRVESEQRRRDDLRDGYRRLKDSLPLSSSKSSKVSLLDRATTHIKYLEMTAQQLQTRLQRAESEVQRLRGVNETLMLGTAGQLHASNAAAAMAAQQQQPSY